MIKILNYQKVNKDKTIGIVDIAVPITSPTMVVIRKIAHKQSGDNRWFSLPVFVREENGKENFMRYFEFETQVYNGHLMNSLSEKVKEFCKEHGIEETPVMEFDSFPEFQENEKVLPW